jgi:tmRNA-binding protein
VNPKITYPIHKKSNAESLLGVSLKVYTDNKDVETILRVGSKKTYLHDKRMDIHETCVENDISISSQWITRESNKEADRLSRMNDCDDS